MIQGKKNGGRVTRSFLKEREERCVKAGYAKQKWITFCETLLSEGFRVNLYEARQTYSKYITAYRDGKSFKVRFSNHKPLFHKEMMGDCDFFVGVSNLGCTTTKDALHAVHHYFGTLKDTAHA